MLIYANMHSHWLSTGSLSRSFRLARKRFSRSDPEGWRINSQCAQPWGHLRVYLTQHELASSSTIKLVNAQTPSGPLEATDSWTTASCGHPSGSFFIYQCLKEHQKHQSVTVRLSGFKSWVKMDNRSSKHYLGLKVNNWPQTAAQAELPFHL